MRKIWRKIRRKIWSAFVFNLALAAAFAAVTPALADPPAPNWVRSVGVSLRRIDPATADTVENVTLRFTARLTLGGAHARLSLSNAFGTSALRIGGASLGYMSDGKLKIAPVTFSGQTAITLPPGAPALSDPIDAALAQGQVVTISLFLPDKTPLISLHSDDHMPSAVSTPGNFVMAENFDVAESLKYQPFFNGVDVVAAPGAKTIVAFGDSITDAGDDTSGPPWRWSDVLAQRLADAGKPYAVANEAISGNRIVTDGGGNYNALSRFDRDVLSLPNVGYIVMLEGINDVGHAGYNPATQTTETSVTADDVISGYKQIIARAHEHGIKVYGAEVLPFKGAKYDSAEHDSMRAAINTWIRTSGAFDALIDFKDAVADPADALQLNPALERGDHLHPNNDGERAMGAAIDLQLFK